MQGRVLLSVFEIVTIRCFAVSLPPCKLNKCSFVSIMCVVSVSSFYVCFETAVDFCGDD